tara:strand:+ start:497 stop:604 length:108 start_codon:yes stop_codon:yes gene_type:complete
MPNVPSSFATIMFALGVLVPFAAVVICAVVGLVKR